jgi:hypothetical protein
VTKSYDARLATRITASAGTRLRQLALLHRRRISHLPDDVLDAALPATDNLAAQFAHLATTGTHPPPLRAGGQQAEGTGHTPATTPPAARTPAQ